MKKAYLLSICLLCMVFGCSKSNNTNQESFTLKGYIVTSPMNNPVGDAIIKVSNEKNTLASSTTSSSGEFSITVDKNRLDASYALIVSTQNSDITKSLPITGYGLKEHDFGNIILYDERNPYELPTVIIGPYTYVLHPVLQNKMNWNSAMTACEELNDFGLSNWFLPFRDELCSLLFETRKLNINPLGIYWSADDNNGYYGYVNWGGADYSPGSQKSTSSTFYVLPASRYIK